MKKIESFTVDHNKLLRGIYVSRKDTTPNGDVLTSFDIRMREPNREPVMSITSMHTNEHLGATFLRNHPQWGPKTVYYGPMGCRTGVYMVLQGDLDSGDVTDLVIDMFSYILNYSSDEKIPGVSAKECGNYQDHNLEVCQKDAQEFYDQVLQRLTPENLNYPE